MLLSCLRSNLISPLQYLKKSLFSLCLDTEKEFLSRICINLDKISLISFSGLYSAFSIREFFMFLFGLVFVVWLSFLLFYHSQSKKRLLKSFLLQHDFSHFLPLDVWTLQLCLCLIHLCLFYLTSEICTITPSHSCCFILLCPDSILSCACHVASSFPLHTCFINAPNRDTCILIPASRMVCFALFKTFESFWNGLIYCMCLESFKALLQTNK